jgi:hypothetical protein
MAMVVFSDMGNVLQSLLHGSPKAKAEGEAAMQAAQGHSKLVGRGKYVHQVRFPLNRSAPLHSFSLNTATDNQYVWMFIPYSCYGLTLSQSTGSGRGTPSCTAVSCRMLFLGKRAYN